MTSMTTCPSGLKACASRENRLHEAAAPSAHEATIALLACVPLATTGTDQTP
jgi:hypothetical protein